MVITKTFSNITVTSLRSGVLNYEVDFGQKVLEVVPVQYLALSVTRDFETLIEVQQSQKQTPAHLRYKCKSGAFLSLCSIFKNQLPFSATEDD